jgi:hypothetical protein
MSPHFSGAAGRGGNAGWIVSFRMISEVCFNEAAAGSGGGFVLLQCLTREFNRQFSWISMLDSSIRVRCAFNPLVPRYFPGDMPVLRLKTRVK